MQQSFTEKLTEMPTSELINLIALGGMNNEQATIAATEIENRIGTGNRLPIWRRVM